MKTISPSIHALVLAAMAAMRAGLGQQLQVTTRAGSGVVAKRDRPTGFWGDPRRHVPRVLTPEQRAKHAEKMLRRRNRWERGLINNPCVSVAQYEAAVAD